MARSAIGTNDFRAPTFTASFTTSTVEYKTGLNATVHKPSVANRPAIVFLHGGGWDEGSRLDSWYIRVSRLFAEKGFGVANCDYTLDPADPQTPIDDVLDAVQYFRTNASTHNFDSSRIAIVGVSAGGHLGIMAGIQGVAGADRPDAVVSWSGAHDLEEAYSQDNGPATIEAYLNVVLSGNEATYRLYSPVDQVTANCPPLRLVASESEDTSETGSGLAVVQLTSMETAAVAVGVSVATRTFAGSVHGLFFDYPGFFGANDVAGTCAWLRATLGENTPSSGRTASSSRSASSGRVAA